MIQDEHKTVAYLFPFTMVLGMHDRQDGSCPCSWCPWCYPSRAVQCPGCLSSPEDRLPPHKLNTRPYSASVVGFARQQSFTREQQTLKGL